MTICTGKAKLHTCTITMKLAIVRLVNIIWTFGKNNSTDIYNLFYLLLHNRLTMRFRTYIRPSKAITLILIEFLPWSDSCRTLIQLSNQRPFITCLEFRANRFNVPVIQIVLKITREIDLGTPNYEPHTLPLTITCPDIYESADYYLLK